MKIVVIGAGSMSFSPSLFNCITRDPALADCELALVDIDQEALEVADRLARRLVVERGLSIRVYSSPHRRDVLAGADVVTATIAVGGLEASRLDIDIPGRYGCIQPVGDTAGPGGLGRALRHVPELVAIATDMADLCPSAVLCNYTNPLTALTRAVLKHSPIECIGLCVGPEMTWRHLASAVGLKARETQARIAGINHCHWVIDFTRDGEDLLPRLSARLTQLLANKTERPEADAEAPATDPFAGAFQPFSSRLHECFGHYPGPGDSHVAEFFPQLLHAPGRAASLGLKNGSSVSRQERDHPGRFAHMRTQAYGEVPLDQEMFGTESYGEESQLTAILAGRRGHRPVTMWANVTNNGTISNLPEQAVVEVPCLVSPSGIKPVPVGSLPHCLAAPLARAVENLEVVIDAALTGSRQQAVRAYLNDPYCTDLETGPCLVNELIDALLPWLPNFRRAPTVGTSSTP